MECRACRNLFRSLPNFLCHKDKFCTKTHDSEIAYSKFVQNPDSSFNLQYYLETKPQCDATSSDSSSPDGKIINGHTLPPKTKNYSEKATTILFEPLKEKNDGIFAHQKRFSCDLSTCDVSNSSLLPKKSVVDTAVLDHDGRIMCMGSAPAIENVVEKLALKLERQQLILEAKKNETCIKCNTCKSLVLFPHYPIIV